MYVVRSQPRHQRRPTRAYERPRGTIQGVFDTLSCSKDSIERLRRLAACGATGPAIAVVAPSDLAPLAALELAKGLVPAKAHLLDIHQAIPEGDRWSQEEVRSLIQEPAYLVAVSRCIVIVHNAHLMDQSCADSILKLMEEPPNNALFLLCVPSADSISVTLQSRLASSVTVNAAPLQQRSSALVDAGLTREQALSVLLWAQDSHAVANAIIADLAVFDLAESALGVSLTGEAPAQRAKEAVTALEELAAVLLAASGEKTSDVAKRARTRVLCRLLISRWRDELSKMLRTSDAAIDTVMNASAALDDLEAALWRYRPTLAALTNTLVHTASL